MVVKLGYATNVFEGTQALLASPPVAMDLMMCLLGPKIADGSFRAVYEHTLDPTKVIKVEFGNQEKKVHDAMNQNTFCNVQEFLLWREIDCLKNKLAWVRELFAPVHWISPGGHVLCMEKTHEMPGRERPSELPEFLWDVKHENFGWIGDKFVCHDYAHVSAFVSYTKRKMKIKDIWH